MESPGVYSEHVDIKYFSLLMTRTRRVSLFLFCKTNDMYMCTVMDIEV